MPFLTENSCCLPEVHLRSLARSCLIAYTVAALLMNASAEGATNPLGMVVAASNAHLGETGAALGTNVFPGDTVQTDPTGTLRLKIRGSQVLLGSASSAVLLQEDQTAAAKVTQGSVGFASAPDSKFEIETPFATVRAADGQSAFGQVTLLGPQKISVAAYHGDLVVTGAGVERIIKEGNAFNITFVPDSQAPEGAGTGDRTATPSDNSGSGGSDRVGQNGGSQKKNGKGTRPAVRNHSQLIFDAMIVGAFAGGGIAAWQVATESSSVPQ